MIISQNKYKMLTQQIINGEVTKKPTAIFQAGLCTQSAKCPRLVISIFLKAYVILFLWLQSPIKNNKRLSVLHPGVPSSDLMAKLQYFLQSVPQDEGDETEDGNPTAPLPWLSYACFLEGHDQPGQQDKLVHPFPRWKIRLPCHCWFTLRGTGSPPLKLETAASQTPPERARQQEGKQVPKGLGRHSWPEGPWPELISHAGEAVVGLGAGCGHVLERIAFYPLPGLYDKQSSSSLCSADSFRTPRPNSK